MEKTRQYQIESVFSFYLKFSNHHTVLNELSYTHCYSLLKVKNDEAREFMNNGDNKPIRLVLHTDKNYDILYQNITIKYLHQNTS